MIEKIVERARQTFLTDNHIGAGFIIISALIMTLNSSVYHHLSSAYPAMQMLFMKSVAGLIILLLICRERIFSLMKTRILHWHILHGLINCVGMWALIKALTYLPIGQVSAISLMSVLLASFGAYFAFNEAMTWQRACLTLTGIVGVLVILQPEPGHMNTNVLWALMSACCFACTALILKKVTRHDAPLTGLVLLMVFLVLFSGVANIGAWVPPTNNHMLWLALVGVLEVSNQLMLINGFAVGEVSFIVPFKFIRFPLHILSGMIFFAEMPEWYTLLGGVLIVSASMTSVYLEASQKPSAKAA